MFGGINPRRAPVPWLPLPFLLSGPLALAAVHLLLATHAAAVVGSYRATATVAVTHLLVLGAVVATMMGALYQMAPVIFVAEAADGRLGLAQGTLYTAGWIAMVAGFLSGARGVLAAGGTAVVLAVLLFLVIIGRVLRTATQWDTPGWYLLAALAMLVATVGLGLTFALDWRFGWFPIPPHLLAIHVHLGGIGWLTLLIMGVSYRLVPMFAIAPAPPGILARGNLGAFIGLLIGLVTLLCLDARRWAISVIAWGLAAAIGVYLFDMARLYRARRRRYDLTLLTMWGAMTCLGVAALMGAFWSTGLPARRFGATQWLSAYAYIALGGWCVLAICAHVVKIVPFLIWLHRYGRGMGRGPVPLLKDLLPQRAAIAAIAGYALGFAITATGLLTGQPAMIRAGAWCAAAGAVGLFGVVLAVLLPHRRSSRAPEHQAARTARATPEIGD
ncbi:MAG: hypothetical protein ACR2JW_15045 [Thermomicrobiales bacterium]